MARYSKELQRTVLERMRPPHSESVAALSEEFGVPTATLYTWRSKALSRGELVSNQRSSSATASGWSAEAKLAAVIETSALTETERSEYCRSKGIHVEELKQWKDSCLGGFSGQTARDADAARQHKADQQQVKTLKRELRRKEKALAESAALLVLSKKMEAIWAEDEDE